MERASVVITHSTLTLDMMARFFPTSIGKIYPAGRFVRGMDRRRGGGATPPRTPVRLARHRRAVRVQRLGPREKNYSMVRAIVARLPGASVHVIGNVPSEVRGRRTMDSFRPGSGSSN